MQFQIQFDQIKYYCDRINDNGYHFKIIIQTLPNIKATVKTHRQNFLKIKAETKEINVSESLAMIRETLCDQIFVTFSYLEKKIDDNLKIHVPTSYVYNLLSEGSLKRIKVIQRKLRLLNFALCWYLGEFKTSLNLSIPGQINPPSETVEELKDIGVNVDEEHLLESWLYLCGDAKNDVPWYVNKDTAAKILARYFNSILDCLNGILKEVDDARLNMLHLEATDWEVVE